MAKNESRKAVYVAAFNLQDHDAEISVTQDEVSQYMDREVNLSDTKITELWQDKTYPGLTDRIPAHGARLYQIEIM